MDDPLLLDKYKKKMPDISFETQTMVKGKLHAVGMRSIEMPIVLESQDGQKFCQKAKIDAFVSLDQRKARGIHMSRLYSVLQDKLQKKIFNLELIQKILVCFVDSQKDLSSSSQVRIQFDWPILRKSLKSDHFSWRYYPVLFEGKYNRKEGSSRLEESKKNTIHQKDKQREKKKKNPKNGEKDENESFEFNFGAKLYYSSTCPCSAALSRQVIQDSFLDEFKEKSLISSDTFFRWLKKPLPATPHAQRSVLKFKVKVGLSQFFSKSIPFIDEIEKSLGTPVQMLVKREDEQEFAKLNATNLMFCEDAARRVKMIFERQKEIEDYMIFVEHFESLHPHTATSFVFKGVEGGFKNYHW